MLQATICLYNICREQNKPYLKITNLCGENVYKLDIPHNMIIKNKLSWR